GWPSVILKKHTRPIIAPAASRPCFPPSASLPYQGEKTRAAKSQDGFHGAATVQQNSIIPEYSSTHWRRHANGTRATSMRSQFFLSTSFCTSLPISSSRRQTFSRNDITLST